MRRVILSLAATLAVAAPALAQAAAPTLSGRAVLPADSFIPGPTSGRELGTAPINGRKAPFEGKQPVQGFSGVLDAGDGTFYLCGDNGFGAIENSADHHLRVYHVRPTFKGLLGGPGKIEVLSHFVLRDPDRKLLYPITHQYTRERVLTGADLDLESFQRAPDGTFWFGDEFGPFLVHTDATGKVLESPIPLPDFDTPGLQIHSPQNPYHEETASLRLMNALRAHARDHGATRMPIFAPFYMILDDGDPGTVSPLRVGPGAPSSEVHNIKLLQTAGHAVVPWTVNDLALMKSLLRLGVKGLISDRPDLLRQAVEEHDADGDGKPGDYLDRHGLIDRAKFDAQGHRGGRNLRPESTFPAFEVGLDNLMSTLETDCGITSDGVPMLHHDPEMSPILARRLDNGRVQGAIHHQDSRRMQREYVLDRLLPATPTQVKDFHLSPVSVAFAREYGLPSPYAWPSLQQLFRFVRFYERYYRWGPGRTHKDAGRRWRNAARVHFDIETKTSTALEAAGITTKAPRFAKAMADVVKAEGLEDRVMIQSFDLRTLLWVQANHPKIQTVFLLGEAPPFGSRTPGQPAPTAPGADTLWRDDVVWPHRRTRAENPFRSQKTGGFEGLALSTDGKTLYPILEKPLTGGVPNLLPIYAFDLASRKYTGVRAWFPVEPGATSVPDFIMTGPETGLLIERDDKEGDMTAYKKVHRIRFGAPGEVVSKEEVADLLKIADPQGFSGLGLPGDVGLGKTFGLPFFTIEGIVKLGPNRLGIVTDNNYPFSVGRHKGTGQPDDSEFVLIDIEKAL